MDKDPLVCHIWRVAKEWLTAWASSPSLRPVVRRAWGQISRRQELAPRRGKAAAIKGPAGALVECLSWI
eukprot:6377979-Lingulodinium_polyedra.AAC.1